MGLREENANLKAEIEQLKFQLQLKQTSIPQSQPQMVAMQQPVGFAGNQPVLVNTMEPGQLTPTAFSLEHLFSPRQPTWHNLNISSFQLETKSKDFLQAHWSTSKFFKFTLCLNHFNN